jgi:molybdate transport system substrate-binding protein
MRHGPRRARRPAVLGFVFVAAVSFAGCARETSDVVLVSATSSLGAALPAIEAAFEDANPGTDVVVNLAASSAVREQVLAGAPVDVVVTASTVTMQPLVDAGMVGDPSVFARNEMQIAVPSSNPGGVTGLEDFSREELLIGLCSVGVPCGDLAREVLVAAGVAPAQDTDEPNVAALVTKLIAGELDAGIVYVTDVLSAGADLEGIDIPPDVNRTTTYPIAASTGAPNMSGADAFVAFVLSDEGRRILLEFGFLAP